MKLPNPPPEIATAGLRTLKTIAIADGLLHPLERQVMASIQRHILGTDHHLDTLPPIDPDELAELVPPGPFRERIVHAAVVVALADGTVDELERRALQGFEEALGVHDATTRALELFADGHYKRLRIGLLRRFVARDRAEFTLHEHGLGRLLKTARTQLRGGVDAELAREHQALGELPEGTLGRGYHDFMRRAGFPLPGEEGSSPDIIAFHDCVHVLSGYGTVPEEEILIASFHAGMRDHDFMGLLLFAITQFHLGVAITPSAEGEVGCLDPEAMLRAFVRGTRVSQDLNTTWDHTADWSTPVAELRERFHILPRT